jgi:nitrite reductase (NADH) small subunit
MSGQWKLICKLKDVPQDGARLVPRGLAWQELPGVALFRTAEDQVYAVLDNCPHQRGSLSDHATLGEQICCPRHRWNIGQEDACGATPQDGCARRYTVKVEDGKVYLDLDELSAPASRAEAALAGSFGVATRVMAFG